jgi:hypothetical protein
VGDACVGNAGTPCGKQGPHFNIEFLHGHGQVSSCIWAWAGEFL